ncbi:MAG: DUF2336 domain-containing protein [Alphaproteobacteria bacterium]
MARPTFGKRISGADVKALASDPSPRNKSLLARKLGGADNDPSSLSYDEKRLAQDIVRMLANDVVDEVRVALADSLKTSPLLPPDVAKELAQDIEEVSMPVLEFSTVLSEDDLVEIVRQANSSGQQAIARRKSVSARLSAALVDHGDEQVVSTLTANDGAEIAESTMDTILDKHPTSEDIHQHLLDKHKLPPMVAERMITMVSERLQSHLIKNVQGSEQAEAIMGELVTQGRERATMGLFDSTGPVENAEELAKALEKTGRLTPSLMIRAICMGDMGFFESALALKAGVPRISASLLVNDVGPLGLKSIFDRTDLPEALLEMATAAITVQREMDAEGRDESMDIRRRRMVERMLTHAEALSDDEVDFLMTRLSDMTGDAPRLSGRTTPLLAG